LWYSVTASKTKQLKKQTKKRYNPSRKRRAIIMNINSDVPEFQDDSTSLGST
jgi:hypothetical protein